MKITVYGRQMNVRESLKEAIEKKLSKFDRYFGEDTEAFVTCKVRKGVKIIEITVNYSGVTFRAEEENETFITALDRAVEGLERQMRKNKTRLENTVKRGAFAPAPIEDDDYEEEAEYS
ncbi:MAG: ribosome-associated translation inhibitor RaiA, partial [Clostridia bacterium]|nr:ribosome-associated translation inhibitor RaiA [Clostridia bacterium]